MMNVNSSVAVEAPESEEREEVAKDVCSLTLLTLGLPVRRPGGNYVTVRAVPDG